MRCLVRMGDPLHPYGGQVLEGHYLAHGKPVACVGDHARCNVHGLTTIIEGCSRSTMDGQPIALDGHRCACGCQLLATLTPDRLQVAP